jgi:hypothetical protein
MERYRVSGWMDGWMVDGWMEGNKIENTIDRESIPVERKLDGVVSEKSWIREGGREGGVEMKMKMMMVVWYGIYDMYVGNLKSVYGFDIVYSKEV